ncbi:MAG: type II toxin-antitoxin system death-on-curing family toxin [Nitrosarchaeum sp.]|nr:type II toxin-antitoxin system death-on-curing family toxin [Nitrosarchaeum sp.]
MTSSNGIVMNLDNQYLIETNEQVLLRHKKRTGESVYIGVIQKNMDEVLPMINDVSNSENKEQDLIEKAARILGVIILKQPFMDGNRRTGIIAAGKFLRDNGYDLDIDPEGENLELRSMLRRIKDRMSTLNPEVIGQLSFYISKRMKEHESRR